MSTKKSVPQTRWLLMIHQMPAKPAYLRVKIGRKLMGLGAVPIKNSVYALPLDEGATAALTVLAEEIVQGGGDALVCETSFVKGLTDAEVRALFDKARDDDYEALAREAQAMLVSEAASRADVQRLHRRREEIAKVDFFSAHGRQSVDDLIADLDRLVNRHVDVTSAKMVPTFTRADLQNRVWVTRKHIHIDRIASAWLIRRFIDPSAKFKFVDGRSYKGRPRELRFDMANAEFTHEGNDCTFETLVRRAELRADAALRHIAEIIHDLDVDEGKFGRQEAAGFGVMMSGICSSTSDDNERLARGSVCLDQFYSFFSKN
ncbi:MAG: chromate resistance protein [Rhodospirillaceae bacterium]|nr:chromate resistance protein [Rhodospirillaceae bacterium]